MTGPVPKKIKPYITKSPEEVAAHESMRTNHLYPRSVPKGPRLPTAATKKAKTIKHTKKDNGTAKSKSREPLFALDITTMRKRPISTAYLEQIAIKLINWVNSRKEIIIDDFLQEHGHSYSSFKTFRDRCPKLEEAYQYAKMCIGNKRERDAYYNKGNAALIMKSLPDYSPRWNKLTKWHAEINTQKQNINQGIQVVEIPAAEKTDIVKPLPKDKDE